MHQVRDRRRIVGPGRPDRVVLLVSCRGPGRCRLVLASEIGAHQRFLLDCLDDLLELRIDHKIDCQIRQGGLQCPGPLRGDPGTSQRQSFQTLECLQVSQARVR